MDDQTIRLFEAVSERIDGPLPRYCPAVLPYFQGDASDAATVDELGTFVSERGRTDDEASRVAVRLHHSTLPKLAASDLVDYDARSNTARYRGNPAIERSIDRVVGYVDSGA